MTCDVKNEILIQEALKQIACLMGKTMGENGTRNLLLESDVDMVIFQYRVKSEIIDCAVIHR